ncbi:AzlC family ABC transporter permease [Ideonella dechloratans]|uniref:AzlC family ABC transporter permease n=1 Tax=Ideonella dechloratans TaxID=36863 RepID=UPI0035B02D7C
MHDNTSGTRPLWRDPAFARGFRELGSASLGIGAWGLVTGVAMVKSGLGVPLSLAMTLLVFAGSAQLAALPLIVQGAPMWLVWATAACVNLRFVIFSAGWRPYFGHRPFWQKVAHAYLAGDLNYVLFIKAYPDPVPQPSQWPFFWGGAAVNWLAWQGFSVLGIVLANHIPTEWGLGFAGTLALLGLTGTLLVDRATWVAGAVAACAALAAYALPLKLNIVVAIAAAVAIGLVMDHLAPAGRLRAQRKELG